MSFALAFAFLAFSLAFLSAFSFSLRFLALAFSLSSFLALLALNGVALIEGITAGISGAVASAVLATLGLVAGRPTRLVTPAGRPTFLAVAVRGVAAGLLTGAAVLAMGFTATFERVAVVLRAVVLRAVVFRATGFLAAVALVVGFASLATGDVVAGTGAGLAALATTFLDLTAVLRLAAGLGATAFMGFDCVVSVEAALAVGLAAARFGAAAFFAGAALGATTALFATAFLAAGLRVTSFFAAGFLATGVCLATADVGAVGAGCAVCAVAVADGVSTFAADFFAGAFLAAGFAAGLTARLVAGFAVTALFGFAVAAVDFLTAGLRVGVTLAELLFLDSISKVFCGIAW